MSRAAKSIRERRHPSGKRCSLDTRPESDAGFVPEGYLYSPTLKRRVRILGKTLDGRVIAEGSNGREVLLPISEQPRLSVSVFA